jgi:hypothetical protein
MCSNNIIKAGYKEIHTQTVAHNHQILSQGSFTEAGVQVDLIKPALVGSLLEKGDFSGIGKPYPTSGERKLIYNQYISHLHSYPYREHTWAQHIVIQKG